MKSHTGINAQFNRFSIMPRINILKVQILLCLSFILTTLHGQVNWEVYHDEEAGFELLTPCPLNKTTDTFELVSGSRILTKHLGVYMNDRDTIWFDVTHWSIEGEPEDIDESEVRMMLDSSIHELEAIMENKSVYRDYSNRFGHPCVLFKIRFRDREASFKHLLLRGNGQYYLLKVYATKESESKPAINRFLDSFRLID